MYIYITIFFFCTQFDTPVWRNGSASVSDAEGFGFKSRFRYIELFLQDVVGCCNGWKAERLNVVLHTTFNF